MPLGVSNDFESLLLLSLYCVTHPILYPIHSTCRGCGTFGARCCDDGPNGNQEPCPFGRGMICHYELNGGCNRCGAMGQRSEVCD